MFHLVYYLVGIIQFEQNLFVGNLRLQVNVFLYLKLSLPIRHNELYRHTDDKKRRCYDVNIPVSHVLGAKVANKNDNTKLFIINFRENNDR